MSSSGGNIHELELMAEGAARAAVLAATMSCCSSEYLLLHVLHVIFFTFSLILDLCCVGWCLSPSSHPSRFKCLLCSSKAQLSAFPGMPLQPAPIKAGRAGPLPSSCV